MQTSDNKENNLSYLCFADILESVPLIPQNMQRRHTALMETLSNHIASIERCATRQMAW